MLYIGCHLGSSKGFENMGREALSIGANTFQFFTRNPRGGAAKAIDEEDIGKFLKLSQQNNFGKIVAHAPYTLNPCSADIKVVEFAHMILEDDIMRMEHLPGNYYNIHPGSHVGQGIDAGIELTAKMLNKILKPEQKTLVLLETMAGKGSEIGSKFEEIKAIIDRVELFEKVGVCMDTCHLNDAGYDVVNNFDGVIEEFDKIIGLKYLKAIHINDSLNPLGSHKDRHAIIGEGYIGTEAIAKIIGHSSLESLPFILETPNELDGHAKEIKTLKERVLHYI